MTAQELKNMRKQEWLDSPIGRQFKKDFEDNKGRISLLVTAVAQNGGPGEVKYLFRDWDRFLDKMPFNDIDARFGIDFQTWLDD